jgi:plastocyanin
MRYVLLIGFAFAWSLQAGTVSGQIELVKSKQYEVRVKHDYSGVVVWLEPIGSSATRTETSAANALIDQRNKTFIPHVLAVESGTAVAFPNSDTIAHNAFSNGDSQIFDLGLYDPKASPRVVFRRPGIAKIFCNVHEQMSAIVAVLPTPYFAVTGANGSFQIQAPAGSYRLRVWHERALPDLLAKLEQQISVGNSNVVLPKIEISEESYQPTPHKNKWGLDYRQPQGQYVPGGRR